ARHPGAHQTRTLPLHDALPIYQRYFPLGGNRFAVVANGGDPEIVRAGHVNVLESRLEDASFTFERDVKKGIDGLAEELAAITFLDRKSTRLNPSHLGMPDAAVW